MIPDDVISGILLAEVDSRKLSDSERLVMLNQLLVGGNETTTSLITNMFWRLLSQRDLYDQVVDEPSLIPALLRKVYALMLPFWAYTELIPKRFRCMG